MEERNPNPFWNEFVYMHMVCLCFRVRVCLCVCASLGKSVCAHLCLCTTVHSTG